MRNEKQIIKNQKSKKEKQEPTGSSLYFASPLSPQSSVSQSILPGLAPPASKFSIGAFSSSALVLSDPDSIDSFMTQRMIMIIWIFAILVWI